MAKILEIIIIIIINLFNFFHPTSIRSLHLVARAPIDLPQHHCRLPAAAAAHCSCHQRLHVHHHWPAVAAALHQAHPQLLELDWEALKNFELIIHFIIIKLLKTNHYVAAALHHLLEHPQSLQFGLDSEALKNFCSNFF
jgi:hypothetical protein